MTQPSPKSINESLSQTLAQTVKSKAKTPFDNAYRAALATVGATYVQGFLVFAGQPYKPLEHAWIETNEEILDPSLPHLKQKAEGLHYFPAQSLSVKKLKAIVEEAKEDYPETTRCRPMGLRLTSTTAMSCWAARSIRRRLRRLRRSVRS
jgi:hypothetical protein